MRYDPTVNNKKPKRIRNIIILLFFMAILFVGWMVFKNDVIHSATSPKSNQKTETSKSVSDESKTFQEALDSMKTLFKDGDPSKYRTDITKDEFKAIEEKIDAISDDKAKKTLEDKLASIKAEQTKESQVTS